MAINNNGNKDGRIAQGWQMTDRRGSTAVGLKGKRLPGYKFIT